LSVVNYEVATDRLFVNGCKQPTRCKHGACAGAGPPQQAGPPWQAGAMQGSRSHLTIQIRHISKWAAGSLAQGWTRQTEALPPHQLPISHPDSRPKAPAATPKQTPHAAASPARCCGRACAQGV